MRPLPLLPTKLPPSPSMKQFLKYHRLFHLSLRSMLPLPKTIRLFPISPLTFRMMTILLPLLASNLLWWRRPRNHLSTMVQTFWKNYSPWNLDLFSSFVFVFYDGTNQVEFSLIT